MSESNPPETLTYFLENELLALRAKGKSFEDLAREQGVKPITNFDDLLGVWPEDERDDGFEEAVLRWRREVMVGNE